jgi:iron complex transport system substrate-binding protein
MLARIVGRAAEGRALVDGLRRGLEEIAASSKMLPFRPRVFFEEWNDPLISGIGWVEQLIEIAGGTVIFPELQSCGKAKDRVVDQRAVLERDPDVILASWCGRKVNKQQICSRPGWESMTAVRNGHVYEIKSAIILQPGPASLTDGVRQMHELLARVAGAGPGLPNSPASSTHD